jgi:hypothetical protein
LNIGTEFIDQLTIGSLVVNQSIGVASKVVGYYSFFKSSNFMPTLQSSNFLNQGVDGILG